MRDSYIEELHEQLIEGLIEPSIFYHDLYENIKHQQEILNCFVTITHGEYQNSFPYLLSGIPYALKDNFNMYGIKTTAGSCLLKNYESVYDAHIVTLLKQQKAYMIGKTTMDEFGMGSLGYSKIHGMTKNPYDHQRIAGGSSAGSAAIVGSEVIPFAIGSDTGDSVRKPAGYCGVIGMKPTWGRISRYGLIPYASSLDHVGIFTKYIKDMAIVLEAISGRDDRDMTSSFHEVPHFRQELNSDISDMKIAILKNVVDDLKDDDVKKNFDHIVDLLKKQGVYIEYIELSQSLLDALLPTYTIIANCESTSHHACYDGIKYGMRHDGKTIEETMKETRSYGFSLHTKKRMLFGSLALLKQNQEKMFQKAQKIRRLIVDEYVKVFQDFDMILTPNSRGIAPLITDVSKEDKQSLIDCHLILANFSGAPSLTLPCGFVDHMPIAINLTANLFEEQKLLNVAYALEKELSKEESKWN